MEKNNCNEKPGLFGDSRQILEINSYIDEIKLSKLPVLIEGETGVGKSLVASMIHNISSRSKMPFIIMRCGAMPRDLLENELFGHEAGAFTGAQKEKRGLFEIADKGTIFLDEIGEIDPGNQVKILDVLETGKFRRLGGTEEIQSDVRIIAATNRTLKNEVENGRFREDLFFRLSVLYVFIPPLRERKEDIVALIEHFLKVKTGKPEKLKDYFTVEDINVILSGKWTGNARELQHFIEKLVVFNFKKSKKDEFLRGMAAIDGLKGKAPEREIKKTFDGFIDGAEKGFLEDMLKKFKYNKTKMTEELNISRAKLYRMLNKYKIN